MIRNKIKYFEIVIVIFLIASGSDPKDYSGMIWIEEGEFLMGGDNDESRNDEFPKHRVSLDGFWIEETEVTNAQFLEFINHTGYVTTAEIAPKWEEIKNQLPPGISKPETSNFADGLVVPIPTLPSGLNVATCVLLALNSKS